MKAMASFKNRLGERYGRLTVIAMAPRQSDSAGKLRPIRWICQCDCGNIADVSGASLATENVRSCGCLREESKRAPKKGLKAKCPYPAHGCAQSRLGVCCRDCAELESCDAACLNRPELCGRDKHEQENL